MKWAKVMDIVNNFESTTSSLKTIQQTPLRTDSVSSYKEKTHACKKELDRKQKPNASGESMCYRCQREGHPPAKCKFKDFSAKHATRKDILSEHVETHRPKNPSTRVVACEQSREAPQQSEVPTTS